MKNKRILLVEDHPDDEALTLRALGKSLLLEADVVVARDADGALAYLDGEGATSTKHALPALVLLDLKLPRVDGHELLRRIRQSERARLVPVVVLTSSSEHRDVTESYHLGANGYVRKRVDFVEFVSAVRTLVDYWLNLNETALAEEPA